MLLLRQFLGWPQFWGCLKAEIASMFGISWQIILSFYFWHLYDQFGTILIEEPIKILNCTSQTREHNSHICIKHVQKESEDPICHKWIFSKNISEITWTAGKVRPISGQILQTKVITSLEGGHLFYWIPIIFGTVKTKFRCRAHNICHNY